LDLADVALRGLGGVNAPVAQRRQVHQTLLQNPPNLHRARQCRLNPNILKPVFLVSMVEYLARFANL